MHFSKTFLTTTILAATTFTSPATFAADTGKINFNGAITASPCSISGEDLDKQVNLGVVTTADLKKGGNTGTSIPRNFTISLENCEVTAGSDDKVTVTLTGLASEYGAQMFGLNQSGRGAGLMLQKDGNNITPGTATPAQQLVNGKNQLNFTAFIQGGGAGAEPVEGDYTATTNITLAYE
ncbi:fimbrial protein [Enterobacter bugandensis]|uniref:fimbrial protein n=1 Tax=Enterobacter bugandensis TaxID=881260 RepID=UPI002FD35AF1